MKILLAFLFATLSLFITTDYGNIMQENTWIAPPYFDTLKNPFANNENAVAEGQKIYESMCWTCHGKTGKGDGPASKGLIPAPADHTSAKVQKQSDGAIYWKTSKGKGQMAPYEKVLSKQQRWKVVSFIRTLKTINNDK